MQISMKFYAVNTQLIDKFVQQLID